MENGMKRRWMRGVALVAAGMVAGSLLLTPATAHLNSPLTIKHLRAHFYSKTAANARFIDTTEAAPLLGTTKVIIVDDSVSGGNKQTDALCPAGYQALGGGINFADTTPSVLVHWNEPLVASDNLTAATAGENPPANGWRVRVETTGGGTFTYSVGVICAA